MSATRFTTHDGIEIDYYTEILTLRHVRHWREYPGYDRCEAWLQRADGAERRWYSLPLGVQGRAGHRYRLCWARAGKMKSYDLVGVCNLASKDRRLSSSTGLVASLFPSSYYGRWAFWLTLLSVIACTLASHSLPDALRRWVWDEVTWWHWGAAPIVAGVVGACASLLRDRRDNSRSFDKFVEQLLSGAH